MRIHLPMRTQNVPAQISAVELQGGEREQKTKEILIIATPKTVIDPWAVVVEFGNAGVAQ